MLSRVVIKELLENRKAKIVLIIICFVLVATGGTLYYLNRSNESNNVKKVFNIYKDNSEYPALLSDYYVFDVNHSSKDTKAGEYNCKNNDCEYYFIAGENIAIYDGDYYIYNFIENTLTKVNLGKERFQSIELLELDEKLRGMIVSKEDKSAYYSLSEKKLVTGFSYDNIWMTNIDMYNDGYMFARKDTNDPNKSIYYVLDIKTGDVMLDNNGGHIEVISNNGYVYYLFGRNEFNEAKIYNSHFKLLFNGVHTMYGITNNGSLVAANDGDTVVSEYDSNGRLLSNSKAYKSVNMIMDGAISVIDSDNYLKVVDYSGNVLVTFVEFTNNLYLHTMYSGISKNIGTLVVEDRNIEKGRTGHCRSFNYENGKVIIADTDVCDNAG